MNITNKIDMYLNEKKIKSVNNFTGISTDGKKILLKQEDSGIYYGEIRDKNNKVESSTTKKTQNQVMKWFKEHNIEDIKWDK